MSTLAEMLMVAQGCLTTSDSARRDAELLLSALLKQDRAYLYTWPDRQLTAQERQKYMALVAQRVQGTPVAYLCGYKGFWNLELEVNHSTLIPRPETELLVELALEKLAANTGKVIDLGSGSGAIALALATERPLWRVFAVDKYPGAMALLWRNVAKLGVENVTCLQSDWFEQVSERDFDLVISNPPYIDVEDEHLQQGDLRFEPRTALVSAEQGLADIKQIAAQSLAHLKPGGCLMLEHGYRQGAAVRQILVAQGYVGVETVGDMNGHERVTLGRIANG